jgi:hypothetical protein
MSKKKGTDKKGSVKKSAAADGELILVLPAEAYKEYETIMNTTGLGQETIDSILKAVFGEHANFHINKISIANKEDLEEDLGAQPQTFKC